MGTNAAGPRCGGDYDTRMNKFCGWVVGARLPTESDKDLDRALASWADVHFFRGLSVEEYRKLLAAIRHRLPPFGKAGSDRLPEAERSKQGWARLEEPVTRIPMPWATLLLLVAKLVQKRKVPSALCLIVISQLYLRPGELEKLKCREVVPPAPAQGACFWGFLLHDTQGQEPGKTGDFDESLQWDTETWAGKILAALKAEKQPDETMFPGQRRSSRATSRRPPPSLGWRFRSSTGSGTAARRTTEW